MKYHEIHEGDEVCWTDKGHKDWRVKECLRENVYKVVRKYADLGRDSIVTITDGNEEYEVFITELF
jgi:septum formation topological specificity factor MinE